MKGLLLLLCAFAFVAALDGGADEREVVVFLLDTSGSMEGQEAAMVQGVNDVLSNMTRTLETTGWSGRFDAEIYTFNGDDGRKLILKAPLRERPSLALEQYRCFGGTPLFDALGDTLEALPDGATLVVATDGEENQSTRFSRARVRELLDEARLKRDVEVIYIYKNSEAFTGGVDLGFMDFKGIPGPHSHTINVGGSTMGASIGANAHMLSTVACSHAGVVVTQGEKAEL